MVRACERAGIGAGGGVKVHYCDGDLSAATDLVRRFHYSGRMPGCRFVATAHLEGGLFGDRGEAVAACVFSPPPSRWAEPVVELTRLVRHPDVQVPLSALIGWAMRWLRKLRECDLAVSFADPTAGHHGGIYQACSWHYGGQRSRRMDGITVDGVFVPARSCNRHWGTSSPLRLKELHPSLQVEPHYDEGKHLYWKPLRDSGKRKAARMGLIALPYPKPDAWIQEAA